MGGYIQRAGRSRRGSGPAVHRQHLHHGAPDSQRRKRGALAHGIGQTGGGRNSKVYAICNVKGRPHVLMITPRNVHHMRVAKACIAAIPPSAKLVGDEGYCSNDRRAWLGERGNQAVIPNKRNCRVHQLYDAESYKQRNVVERMFCCFKDRRRVAIRFDLHVKTSWQPLR
jgi:transposase